MRAVVLALLVGGSIAGGAETARAANEGEADPALLLRPIATFPSPEAARRACGPGEVVWADRYAGYYYDPGEAKFGATAAGSFACRQDARRGNYWNIGPGDRSGHPGRTFPFQPLFVGS